MSTDPADDLAAFETTTAAGEVAAAANGNASGQPDSSGQAPVEEPAYPSLTRWVGDWLAPTVRRPDRQDQAWCPQWWRHNEAISRLEALWRSWEALRLDGTVGMSVWWRDHADHHLRQLFDGREGPFSRCRGEHKAENPPLTVEEPPANWFGWPQG